MAEVEESGLRRKLWELQIEFPAEHTEVPAGLFDVVRRAERSITLEEQLKESDWKLQEPQRE